MRRLLSRHNTFEGLGGPGDRLAPEAGQATIEFACIVTVLLLLIVGTFEFAPAVVRTAQLTQAAREGASYAALSPTDSFGIRKRVVQSVPVVYGSKADSEIAAMTDSDIAITCTSGLNGTSKSCSSATIGDTVTVIPKYNFQLMTPLFVGLLDAPLELRGTATCQIV
jgi:Flp pilus assembly protein TadG